MTAVRKSLFRLLAACFVAAILLPEAAAQLVVEPPAIDFGERGQNERPEATVLLRNAGKTPLVVLEIKRSCDCLTLAPPRIDAPIPVGGTIPLRVSMGSGRAMGRLDKHITIVLKTNILTKNVVRPEVNIPVSMRVLEDFEMEPRGVRLEGICGGPPERATVEVKLRRGMAVRPVNLQIKSIRGSFDRPSGQYLKASASPIPGGQRVTVELDSAHPEGPISAELEVSLNGRAVFIPINGEMFAWIKVSPNYINFSRATPEDPASSRREVKLSSTDGTAFKVLGVESKPYRAGEKTVRLEFSVEPGAAGQAAGADQKSTSHKIVCKAFPGEGGGEATFFGTVTVRTDHPKKPEITLKYSGFFAAPAKTKQ